MVDNPGYCANAKCGTPITATNTTHIGGRNWCSQNCWSKMMHAKTNAESLAEYNAANPEIKKEK